jgi:transcriptional regulator GlxA family with amidase domain
MLTARASEGDKLHALTIGADDYLIKPFSQQELLVRIQNLLNNYESRKLWQTPLTAAVQSISSKIQSDREQKEKNVISKKDLEWLKRVELHIQENLMKETFDIQLLSEKMFLSKRQFERKIKLLTGLTPAKLVTEIRLKKGRKFLENGDYATVAEVSFAIGIQTPSHFSKIYTKRFGKKPSSYFS